MPITAVFSQEPDSGIWSTYLTTTSVGLVQPAVAAPRAAFNWLSLLITISGFDCAVGGSLILLARCESGSTGGIEIFPHSRTGFFAIPGDRQRRAHFWANV